MRTWLLAASLIFGCFSWAFADPSVLYTPASGVELAHKDACALAAAGHDVSHYRWLSSYNAATKEELQSLYELGSFVTNQLNFHGHRLSPAIPLHDGRLLRISIHDLSISAEAWDELGRKGSGIAPFPEPYFHTTVEKAVKYKRATTYDYRAGRWNWEEYTKEKQQVLAIAEHVSRDYALKLFELTGSEFPVYRTDWFCNYALQTPAYERFQGNPKDFADFLKLGGVKADAFDRTAVALRGAALRSEVTFRNRIIERIPTDRRYGDGYFYNTLDYFTSIGKNDVISNLLNRKRDAGEMIWSLPNGLQGYGLVAFDAEKNIEKQIGFADANKAALDNRTKRQIKTVISGMSCVHCHAKGAIPVADETRLTATDTVALLVKDPKEAERIGDVYFGADINAKFFVDQVHYAAAVKALCGKDPAAIALAFEDLLYRYQDAPLGIDEICIEMGYPKETVLPLIGEVSRAGQLDQTFVRQLRARVARRDQFEAVYHQLQRLLIRVPASQR